MANIIHSSDFCKDLAEKVRRIIKNNKNKIEVYDDEVEYYRQRHADWENKRGEYAKWKNMDQAEWFEGDCWGRPDNCKGAVNYNEEGWCAIWAKERGYFAAEDYTMGGHWVNCGPCHTKRDCYRPDSSKVKYNKLYKEAEPPKQPPPLELDEVPVFNCCQQNLKFDKVGGKTDLENIKLMNNCVVRENEEVVAQDRSVKEVEKAEDGVLVERERQVPPPDDDDRPGNNWVVWGVSISTILLCLSLFIAILFFVFFFTSKTNDSSASNAGDIINM